MRRLRLLIPVLAVVFLLGGIGLWKVRHDPQATSSSVYGKDSVLKVLDGEGVHVKQTAPTNLYAMFGLEPGSSLGIWTEMGFLDVTFFPQSVEGKLKVEEVGQYAWRIHGWKSDPQDVGSNRPRHFIIHRNLFMMTDDEHLHGVVKKALGAK